MKTALALLVFGLLALPLQASAARFLPGHWVPDLGLLVVVAAGLRLAPGLGLGVAAALGFLADLLSGALLGQHALLRVLAFVATRLANRQIDLRRGPPLVIFVAVLVLVDALALVALSGLLGENFPLAFRDAGRIAAHALCTACFALPVRELAEALHQRLSEGASPRRLLHIETRRSAR